MQGIQGRSWMRDLAARNALTASIRFESRYALYPKYAVLLAAVIWLFTRLPADTLAILPLSSSPVWLGAVGFITIAGSALASALGCVGVWRPGRNNMVLSCLALVLTSTNWM